MKYEMETLREIWPDKGDGERLEVGPDRDGLGLVEIRQRECNGEISERIQLGTEQAALVAKAILLCVKEILESEAEKS